MPTYDINQQRMLKLKINFIVFNCQDGIIQQGVKLH